MTRISLGQIFEVETKLGKVYIHYVFKDSELGSLVRVLNGVHPKQPDNLTELVEQEHQFVVFIGLAAGNRQKMIRCVGNHPVGKFDKPSFMRTQHVIRGKLLGWHIVNTDTWQRQLVETLSIEQRRMSPWGVWSIPLLIENLEKGWSLETW